MRSRKKLAETLSVIGSTLLFTAIMLLMAAYFDFPWVAGIGIQVFITAAVVGGVLLYGKAKTRKSMDRRDKKAGIVSCTVVALFLGPAVLNAAEVTTWTRATTDSEPSSIHLTLSPVCAANDGEDGSGAFGLGAAPQNPLLVCIGLAIGGLALAATCIAVTMAVVGATGGIGAIGVLKIMGACGGALGAILVAVAVCFTSGDPQQSEE